MRHNRVTSRTMVRTVRGWDIGVTAAILAVVMLGWLVAACGGNGLPGAARSAQYGKALAFSQCMRSHGALGFPDPTLDDGLPGWQFAGSAGAAAPQFQAAERACQRLLPESG
jgi:hypothetical protein